MIRKRFVRILALCILTSACQVNLFAQKSDLDSLYSVWMDTTKADSVRTNAYINYIRNGFMFNDADSAFKLEEALIHFAEKHHLPKAKAAALQEQGVSLYLRSRHVEALNYYKQALKIYENAGAKRGVLGALGNIGIIYSVAGYEKEAMKIYEQALKISEEIGDKYQKAYNLSNIAIIYKENDNDSLAILYFEKSIALFEETGDRYGLGTTLGNVGEIYLKQNDYNKALAYQKRSLEIRRELNDQRGIMYCYKDLGYISLKKKNYKEAVKQCKASFDIGEKIGSVIGGKLACKCLYDAYKALGNNNQALFYHEKMIAFEIDLEKDETSKKLQQMEFDKLMKADSIKVAAEKRAIEQTHKEEVIKEKGTQNWLIAGGILALLFAGGFYFRWRFVRKSKAALQVEKDRSENLLNNILPEEIAAELKEKGKAEARDFDLVSVLFTDFKGFTQHSENMSASDLLSEINHCFEAFDAIVEKYGIEKIKTIGDAYLAAGGIPAPSDDSVKKTVLAAIDMQAFIITRLKDLKSEDLQGFEMRVGVHTGPVVAGIVGVKKFQYDIWGDTVNTASRMESSGEAGKVNISRSTYDLIKDDPSFLFESRGMIEAKGKGKVDMYFVERSK